MEIIIVFLFFLFFEGIRWVIEKIQDATGKHHTRAGYSHHIQHHDDTLPNGYSRQDYYQYGYTDADIEYWGLDQPSAPSPAASGFVIADMLDGDIDGDIDFPF